jgi:hypothetical protein
VARTGEEIVVHREHRLSHAHKDVYIPLRDAFRAARRRVEDYVRRMRGLVKSHQHPATGHVSRLWPSPPDVSRRSTHDAPRPPPILARASALRAARDMTNLYSPRGLRAGPTKRR